MVEANNDFVLIGVVRYATQDKASVAVEGVDYVVPVMVENATELIGKEVQINGHISMNFDHVVLVADWANVR